MSKILDIKLARCGKIYLKEPSHPIICTKAVFCSLNRGKSPKYAKYYYSLPSHIRLRVYTKNPKRKGTIHVVRVSSNKTGCDRYFYKWCNHFTPAWIDFDDIINQYKEVWIVIEQIPFDKY